jgi:uncharacterized membrane protein
MSWILLFAALIVGADGIDKLSALTTHVNPAQLNAGWAEVVISIVLIIGAVVIYWKHKDD